MSRPLGTVFTAAITGSTLTVTHAVDFEFGGDTGTARFFTGLGDLVINGNTYTGVGNLGAISSLTEDNKLGVNGMTFTLSGVPPELLAIAMNIPCRNKPVKMYVVLFSPEGNIVSNQLCFNGRMDQMILKEDGNSSSITITAESQVIDFNRPRLSRWTYNQRKDQTDNGLKNISRSSGIVIPWGNQIVYMNRSNNTYDSTYSNSSSDNTSTNRYIQTVMHNSVW